VIQARTLLARAGRATALDVHVDQVPALRRRQLLDRCGLDLGRHLVFVIN
jgi:hypothetical protein